jgi:hypothetical protein
VEVNEVLNCRSRNDHSLCSNAAAQLLVREPYAVLQSFAKVLEPSQQELGYTVRNAQHMYNYLLGMFASVLISQSYLS